MGLFGSRTRPEMEMEPAAVDENEPYEEIPSLPNPLTSTVIATGVTVSGTMEGEGVIQVEGTVQGEIKLQGAVIIAATGRVRGPIAADVLQVAGNVEGDVTARDHVCLEKTGSLEGDVTTPSLVIQDGGRFNGRSIMAKGAQAKSTAPPSGDTLQFGPNYHAEEEPEAAG